MVLGDDNHVLGCKFISLTEPLLLYVAGKYRGDVKKNINEASKVGAALWGMGHYVITPHCNTAYMERYSHVSAEQFLAGDLRMLSHCDGIVLLPGWEESEGARGEEKFAREKGLLRWEWPSCPPPPENASGDSE